MKRIALVVASLTLSGGLALAQTGEEAAKQHFMAGNTAYNLAKYDEAVGHFTKAYEAWPQPEFLYNIAQSYRLAGNCKQALFFYKRFKSLKEKDSASPLSAKKREEVDRFIKELTDCAAKADQTAGTQPDTIDNPTGTTITTGTGGGTTTGTTGTGTGTTGTTGGTGTTGTTNGTGTTDTTGTGRTTPVAGTDVVGATGGTAANGTKTVGVLETPDGGGDMVDTGITKTTAAGAPTMLSARMTAGIALLSSGDLDIPVQPSIGIAAGYPIPVGPLTLEVGAGFAWTPLPYETADGQQQGRMFGVRAMVGAVYPVAPKIGVRGDLGIGIASLSGLGAGNPLSEMRDAGGITLPSVRFGVSADYAITPNLVAYVSPFGLAFSPGNDRLYGSNLREIDVLVGVGYRQ